VCILVYPLIVLHPMVSGLPGFGWDPVVPGLVLVGASSVLWAATIEYVRGRLSRVAPRGSCQRCGYDLRGSVGRADCPECGQRIDWERVRVPVMDVPV